MFVTSCNNLQLPNVFSVINLYLRSSKCKVQLPITIYVYVSRVSTKTIHLGVFRCRIEF